MNSVIHIGDTATSFYRFTKEYQERMKVGNEITFTDCCMIIHSLIEAGIKDKLIWCKPAYEHERYGVLQAKLPWFSLTSEDSISDIYNAYILDTVELEVNALLDAVVPKRTWNMISSRLVRADVFIMEDIDFRIYDWTRRVQSGEIKWKR